MSAAPNRHRVAVMVIPGVLALDFGIAAQVFAEDPHYDLVVCAETAAAVSSSGFAITAPARLDALDRADSVIIPGYRDIDAPVSQSIVYAPRRHMCGVPDSCRSVREPLRWPPPDCLMAGPRPRTGRWPTSCAVGTPGSTCGRTTYTSTTP